ncbi:MAG: hypothetical protein ABIG11_00755 [bacterium]
MLKKKAKAICYALGAASVSDLQYGIADVSKDTAVILHINDLFDAWRLGVAQFFDEIGGDCGRSKRIYKKA